MVKVRLVAAAAVSVVALAVPAVVFAHFILAAPQSWITENQLGDPQTSPGLVERGAAERPGPHRRADVDADDVGRDQLVLEIADAVHHVQQIAGPETLEA